MSEIKDKKVEAIVKEAAAEFFKRESDRTSMITVTRAEILNRGKKALVFISVFPEEKESDALAFSKRRRSDMHQFLIKETGLSLVPLVDVLIDVGEKNRQKLDLLENSLNNSK